MNQPGALPVNDPRPTVVERLRGLFSRFKGGEASKNPLLDYLSMQEYQRRNREGWDSQPAKPREPLTMKKVVDTMNSPHASVALSVLDDVGPAALSALTKAASCLEALYQEEEPESPQEKEAATFEDPTGNLKRFEEPAPRKVSPSPNLANLPKGKIPTTGPEAIQYALSKIDLGQVHDEQMDIVHRKLKSKRPHAVKLLGYLEGFKRTGIQPRDLLINRVPVIPPKFRPFSVAGDTFVPGNANELYRDLIEMRDAHGELENVLGPEGAAPHKLDIYDAVKAVYGYGEPTNPKTRERQVSGFLKQVIGPGPKFSFPQKVLLSKNQDYVGRGVIGVDPDLDLDQIAIPEEMAWKLYQPYTMRRLVRHGMHPADAVTAVRDRTDLAKHHMLLETHERPVIYSRAPSWHRFNVVSAYPRVIKGDTIMINPLVTTGMTADFDGDTINVHLPSMPESVKDAKEKLLPSKMLWSIKKYGDVVPVPKQELVLGLWAAQNRPAKNKYRFRTEQEALQAIKAGKVSLSDEVEIG